MGAQTAIKFRPQDRPCSAGGGRWGQRQDGAVSAANDLERSRLSPLGQQRILLMQLRASYEAGQVIDRPASGEDDVDTAGRVARLSRQIEDLNGLIGDHDSAA